MLVFVNAISFPAQDMAGEEKEVELFPMLTIFILCIVSEQPKLFVAIKVTL